MAKSKKPKRVPFYGMIKEDVIKRLKAKSETDRKSMAAIIEDILDKNV